MCAANAANPATLPSDPGEGFGLPGRIVLSWTMAGAIAGGGFLAAGLALTRGSAPLSLLSIVVLAGIGALLGFAHGSLLAVLGRPLEESAGECVHHLAASAIWAIPEFAAAGLIALLIAIGPEALSFDNPLGLVTAAFAIIVGGGVCLWAAREGRRALRIAFARWPERRYGIPVLLTVFAVVAAGLLVWRPQVWWTDLHVGALGAVLLSLGITIWIAVPVTWLVLHHRHTRPSPSRASGDDDGLD